MARLIKPKDVSQRTRDILAVLTVVAFAFAYWSNGKAIFHPWGLMAFVWVVLWFAWNTLWPNPETE